MPPARRAVEVGHELRGRDDVDVVPHGDDAAHALVHHLQRERAEAGDVAVRVARRALGGRLGLGRRVGVRGSAGVERRARGTLVSTRRLPRRGPSIELAALAGGLVGALEDEVAVRALAAAEHVGAQAGEDVGEFCRSPGRRRRRGRRSGRRGRACPPPSRRAACGASVVEGGRAKDFELDDLAGALVEALEELAWRRIGRARPPAAGAADDEEDADGAAPRPSVGAAGELGGVTWDADEGLGFEGERGLAVGVADQLPGDGGGVADVGDHLDAGVVEGFAGCGPRGGWRRGCRGRRRCRGPRRGRPCGLRCGRRSRGRGRGGRLR